MQNPFKPSQIVSDPDDFYGRSFEIRQLARLLRQGSIAIQGSFGVGKSSLLSRTLLHMDQFASDEISTYKIVVGHGDIQTIDQAAQLVLEELVAIDSKSESLTVGIPKLAQYASTEAYTLFEEGRHLAALNRILEDGAFKDFMSKGGFFVIAIDEVEKCAPAIARLFRQVATKSQLNGINNIRFIFAGVSPFVEAMVKTDPGVMRFIYETIELQPFGSEEALGFLHERFSQVVRGAESDGFKLGIDPAIIHRIFQLSGGHPHLLQLLGSHVIEHEYENPDGTIDTGDLVGSLRDICYRKRAPVYDALIHELRMEAKYDSYQRLLELMGGAFPGRVDATVARTKLGKDSIAWLLSRDIVVADGNAYELVDELLRVRVLMDLYEDYDAIETEILEHGELRENSRVLGQLWDLSPDD
jgi:hypothetical protein